MEAIILHCFESHKSDFSGDIKFTYDRYESFWLQNEQDNNWLMRNRDGSFVPCKVSYYPLPYYKDLRALIEIGQSDFREIPVYFLFRSV